MKEPVNCPAVIRSYDANIGGTDKSDMLVHIYRTAMKSKRWYLRLFAYVIVKCGLQGLQGPPLHEQWTASLCTMNKLS